MEKRPYFKQFSIWWGALETDFDDHRDCSALFSNKPKKNYMKHDQAKSSNSAELELNFKSLSGMSNRKSNKIVENCYIIKEALQKLQQFLSSSHKSGCSDPNCIYDDSMYQLKLLFREKNANYGEFKLPKKRGRKRKVESPKDSDYVTE